MSVYYVCGTGDAHRLPLLTQVCVGVCFAIRVHLDVRRHLSALAAKRGDGDEAVMVLVEHLIEPAAAAAAAAAGRRSRA